VASKNAVEAQRCIVLTLSLSALLDLPTPDLNTWRSIRFPDLAVVDPTAWKVIVGFGEIG